MFGRKKKDKVKVKTFVDGQEVEGNDDAVPVPKQNPEIAPALESEQVPIQEPPQSQEGQPEPVRIVVDCLICSQTAQQGCPDYGFYVDATGVWHKCPRCNPTGALTPTRVEKDKSTSKAKKTKKKKGR